MKNDPKKDLDVNGVNKTQPVVTKSDEEIAKEQEITDDINEEKDKLKAGELQTADVLKDQILGEENKEIEENQTEEILKKLEGLKEGSTKIDYLKEVLKKENLLDEKTKDIVYNRLESLYINQFDLRKNNLDLKISDSDKEIMKKCADYLSKNQGSVVPALLYRGIGDKEGMKKWADIIMINIQQKGSIVGYDLALDLYIELGDRESLDKIITNIFISNNPASVTPASLHYAASLFDKIGELSNKESMKKCATMIIHQYQLYKRLGTKCVSEAAKLYEKADVLKGDDINALKNLYKAYKILGEEDKAIGIKKLIQDLKKNKRVNFIKNLFKIDR
jgi:hypothetical protein